MEERKHRMVGNMQELQKLKRKIEALRKELDKEVENRFLSQKCQRLSAQLDQLIVEYMERRENEADTQDAAKDLKRNKAVQCKESEASSKNVKTIAWHNEICECWRVDLPSY